MLLKYYSENRVRLKVFCLYAEYNEMSINDNCVCMLLGRVD